MEDGDLPFDTVLSIMKDEDLLHIIQPFDFAYFFVLLLFISTFHVHFST